MQKVVVNFDKSELQKTVDFHLSVASFRNIKSQEEYRKSLYREFIKSSLNQLTSNFEEDSCEDSYPFSSEVTMDLESKNVGVEIQDDFDFELGSGLEDENVVLENQSTELWESDTPTEDKNTVLENQNVEYSESGVFIEDVDTTELGSVFVQDGVDEPDECCGGTFIEYVDVSEEVNTGYCDKGVFIEDIDIGTPNDVDSQDDIEEFDVEDEDGGILYEEEGYLNDTNAEESFDYEEVEVPEESSEEAFEYVDDIIDEEVSEYEDVEVPEESEDVIEQVIPDETVKSDDVTATQVVDVPSDIRVFLKKNPNSDIDFVLKYYSKKEVEKALKLGRIYKKRGKLVV